VFGVFCALLLLSYTKEKAGLNAGLIAVLVFYLAPVTRRLSGSSMVDLGLTFYFIISGLAFLKWIETGKWKWIRLFFVFSAFSFGVKYTGVMSLLWIPAGLLYAIMTGYQLDIKLFSRKMISGIVLFAVLISPWLIRNYAYTGNAVSPFLYKYLGGRNWNEYLEDDWKWHLKGGVAHADVRDFLKQKISFIFRIFEHLPMIIAAFFVFFFREGGRRSVMKFLLVFSLIYIITGVFIFPGVYRFYLPAAALLCAVSGTVYSIVLDTAGRPALKAVRILIMLFLIAGISNRFAESGKDVFERMKVISGSETREEYLRDNLDCYGLAAYINGNLSWSDSILSLNETRAYYFNTRFLVSHEVVPGSIVHTSSDISLITAALKGGGINYLFLSKTKYRKEHQRHTVLLDGGEMAGNFRLVADDGTCYLYSLEEDKELK
jgi:hypothetical protein